MISYMYVLTETGIDVNRRDFVCLSEAKQVAVTDDVLSKMMKFITDKYNAMDFSEIEKSAGDISRFKYGETIVENLKILESIYSASTDPGAAKYLEVCAAIRTCLTMLTDMRAKWTTCYKAGNGMIQLLYTSIVSGMIYAIGALVSNTIRFITTDQDATCEVLYDEIPGTIKSIYIKNILSAAKDIDTIRNYLNKTWSELQKTGSVNESITIGGGVAAGLLVAGGIILLLPRIITLIREIIYSIYFLRVKLSDMLGVQSDLIKTNIESLEAGRGNKKVIVRQKRIAQKLEHWQHSVALRLDTAEVLKNTQQRKENTTMRIDRDSPLMNPDDSSAGLML